MSSVAIPSTEPTTNSARITNPILLTLARVLWVLFAVFVVTANLLALPQVFEGTICQNIDPTCTDSLRTISQDTVDRLTRTGVDYRLFVIAQTSITLIFHVVFVVTAILLFWRRSDDRMVMVLSASLLCFGTLSSLVDPIGTITTFMLVLTFPTGSFSLRWVSIGIIIMMLILQLPISTQSEAVQMLGEGLFVLAIAATFGVVIYRYRRVFTLTQRQQAKWLLFSMATIVLYWLINFFLIIPLLEVLGNDTLINLDFFAFHFFAFVLDLLIPVSLWIAVTRDRLFDLNFVMNRSLVYGIVTVAMIILFALLFVGVQALLSTILGSQQGVIAGAVAAAVPFALFNPTRRIVGSFVDRRLFRLRYDLNEVADAQKKPGIKNPGIYTGRTFGSYEVLGVLGKGGMGEVYKGFGNGQTVAIKVLPEDLAQKEEFRKRFEREVKTLSSLSHPHIVKLYDSGVTDDSVHYLAMEHIEGQELSDFVQPNGIHDLDSLHDWLRTVASALDYIHDQGLVHRDLKPSNIMLRKAKDSETWEAVLMDFGIARVNASGTRLTGSGTVGTIDYMSPEQIMAAREVDKRSDIYSLGIITYELLTGERPFKGGAGQVLFAHLQQPPPDVRDLKPEIQRSLSKAVEKAMAKKAEDRFESASEFVEALA